MKYLPIVTIGLLVSCANPVLKKSAVASDAYTLPDSMLLVNAIVCHRLIDNLGRELEVNQELLVDSVIELFYNGIKLAPVKVDDNTPVVKEQSPCYPKWNIRFKDIDHEQVKNLARDTILPYLIPLISIETRSWRNTSTSISGGVSGGGINKVVFVRIMFFVVQNNIILYHVIGFTGGKGFNVDDVSEGRMNMEAAKMNDLILLFEEDYAKAVRKKKPK